MPPRLGRLLVAFALILGGQLPAVGSPPTARAAGLQIQRLAGPDRYATAAAISRASFAADTPIAFVADGTTFPDALSAGPLAAGRGGPILLTAPDWLPPATSDELGRLRPAEIVVLGGGGSVSGSVAARLVGHTTSGRVTRISGADRYATSAAVSAAAFPSGAPVAYLALGRSYPDALSGGVAAAVSGGPLLLTEPNAIPGAVQAELARLAPQRIIVLGGAAAISDAVVQAAAGSSPGVSVIRLGGVDRYATSALVSKTAFPQGASATYLSTGLNFPDALAAAAVAGRIEAPLLLVRGDHAGPAALGEAKRLMPSRLVLLGASPTVSERVTLETRVTLGDLAPLPVCRYTDVAAAHGTYGDWPISLLDTTYRVASTYRPPDLVDSSTAGLSGGHALRSLVRGDLIAMRDRALMVGRAIDIQSAFRSYATQQATFDYWVARVGYTQALRTSARAGHSEHQLGTGFDFMSRGAPDPWDRGDWSLTPAGAWMRANAWRYGFVMSYPRGAFSAVCYDYEPWHYRYYGRTQAAGMHASALLPREYLWLHADGKAA